MGKRKLLALVFASVVVLAAGSFGAYKLLNKPVKKTADTKVAPVQTKEQIATVQKSSADFDSVMASFNAKDNAKTISLALEYGSSASNDDYSKLNAYSMCIDAAEALKQPTEKKACYDAAIVIANKLEIPEARTDWNEMLGDAYNGTNLHKGQDDDSAR